MPTKPLKAHYQFGVTCGMCGRSETITYVNAGSIATLKAQTQGWVWRPKQEFNVCPECYAQKISRKRGEQNV